MIKVYLIIYDYYVYEYKMLFLPVLVFASFVLIMMQRLIGKQIWKNVKVWEGFIKCCQRIKPISHQVLLQLPATQLREVLTTAPDLKDYLCKHVQELSVQQVRLILCKLKDDKSK